MKTSKLENGIISILNYNCSSEKVALPKKIMFELTNACDLHCNFCSTHLAKRKKSFMDFGFFKHVLDEAITLGVKECALFTSGESLLHPDIMKFIEYSSKFDLYNYISTGGKCLTQPLMDQLITSGLKSIKFSIDAGTEETYKKIKGKSNSLQKLYQNIKYLFEERNKRCSGLKLYGGFAVDRDNEEEIDAFMAQFYPVLDDVFFKFVASSGMKLFKEIKIDSKLRNQFYNVEKERHHPCPLMWERLMVQVDGSLTACCPDYENEYVYANLKKDSLEKAWNNEIIQSFRKEMIEAKFDKLKFCSKCEGVRGNRASLLGNFNNRIKEAYNKEQNHSKIQPNKENSSILKKIQPA